VLLPPKGRSWYGIYLVKVLFSIKKVRKGVDSEPEFGAVVDNLKSMI
jgi:hypothetical protein